MTSNDLLSDVTNGLSLRKMTSRETARAGLRVVVANKRPKSVGAYTIVCSRLGMTE